MFAGRKLPLTLVFVALVTLSIGVSCKGFFVDPTLTTVAVGPATPTIPLTTGSPPVSGTQQFTAVGTFSDGSTSSTPVTWSASSSGGTTVATIDSSSGLATAQAVGSATITATSTKNPTISGNTTLTVVPANVTSITVTPSSQSTTTAVGFTLTAKDQSGDDISSSVTWTFTVNGTTETGITSAPASGGGEAFTIGTLNPPQTPQYTLSIVAKLTVGSTTITSNTVTVTVTS